MKSQTKTPCFNWRPPAWVKAQLEESAKANGRTLNAELTRAVMEYLKPRYRTLP